MIELRGIVAKKNHVSTKFSNNDLTAYIYNVTQTIVTNISKDKGKWYYELKLGGILNLMVGIVSTKAGYGSTANSPESRYYESSGRKRESGTTSAYGAKFDDKDVIGVALDLDAGTIEFYKNGASQGIAFTNLSALGLIYPSFTTSGGSSANTVTANFGDESFIYPITDGYKPYGWLPKSKRLIQSNNKIYSLESTDIWHETNMTSNTAPAPLVASRSSVWTSGPSYEAWRTFSESAQNWMSSKKEAWVQLDFKNATLLNRVRIKSAVNEDPLELIQLLGSNDGVVFDKIQEYRIDSWEQGTWRTLDFNKSNYSIYRIHVVNETGSRERVAINQIILGLYDATLKVIPGVSMKNFIDYGSESINFSTIIQNKDYILQEKSDDIRIVQLNRKPLSIKFS